ncbi:MAG: WYL domain-containing protein, partial [Oscillospiraceae bacterium]|nr:WYL domain-containing protein [Oscillospiraceae bacterium]
MLFNEIYSLYYKAVEKAIDSAIKGELNDKILRQIIRENAFCESELTIVPAIKEEKWQIVCADGSTPKQHTQS